MNGAVRGLLSSLKGIRRTARCATCGAVTLQMRHGYTVDGTLWKGHVCECRGWHCQSCQAVIEKKKPCCR